MTDTTFTGLNASGDPVDFAASENEAGALTPYKLEDPAQRAALLAALAAVAPAQSAVKLTKGSAMTGTCRALLVGTAGTANLSDAEGAVLTNVPLQQGYNPIGVSALAAGGTADDIWALY